MPEYVYRAVTEKGQIVRNRVEDVSKNTLIKRLKSNNLLPISVSQVGYRSAKKHKSKKRNVTDIDDIMPVFCCLFLYLHTKWLYYEKSKLSRCNAR